MSSLARLTDEETILPETTEPGVVVDLLKVLRAKGERVPEARARLVSADGASSISIPDSLHDILVKALEALSSGYAVTIAPQNTTLTTQQAAEILGVSRPTLTKLLDDGKIPYDRPNSHRRIKLADVLAYQQTRRRERRQLLADLTAEGIDMGLYDEPLMRNQVTVDRESEDG